MSPILTLFGKPSCHLCNLAKESILFVLKDLGLSSSILHTVNINKSQTWWNKYCFDIPVLHIEDSTRVKPLIKIMHRIDEFDLKDKLSKYK